MMNLDLHAILYTITQYTIPEFFILYVHKYFLADIFNS